MNPPSPRPRPLNPPLPGPLGGPPPRTPPRPINFNTALLFTDPTEFRCSSSVNGWNARGRTGLDRQIDSNIASSSGILTSSLNNASISSFPYRCSASLYLGPGEGGGEVTLFPLDKLRSHSGPNVRVSDILI